MTQCDKIRQLWLEEGEWEPAASHVELCESCRREHGAWLQLVRDLRELSLPEPDQAFFGRQRQNILVQVHQDVPSEIPAEETELLSRELEAITLEDPGDLFFRRQLLEIQKKAGIPNQGRRSPLWVALARPLAAAAAVLLLILGIGRLRQVKEVSLNREWPAALEYLAEVEPSQGFGDIEDLNPAQLQRLATRLENVLYLEVDEEMVEDPSDYEELEGPELDLLIRRLEAKVRT